RAFSALVLPCPGAGVWTFRVSVQGNRYPANRGAPKAPIIPAQPCGLGNRTGKTKALKARSICAISNSGLAGSAAVSGWMTEPMTDRDLLRDYAEGGSESAFQELVERHVDLVFATVVRRLGDAAAAEEITQDVFITLARKALWLRRETTLVGWL